MTITISEKVIKRSLLIILIVLVCTFLIQVTYAKYKKYAQGLVDSDVAKWNIKVNDESISNKTILTNTITPEFAGDTYTKAGVLAPGTDGYFEIDIDATDSDVSFTYDLSVSRANPNTITDLKITGFSKEEGVIIPNTTNNITGSIAHNTPSTKIKVFIEWDDDTGTMDNTEDTAAVVNGIRNANILATLHLVQLRS